MKIEPNERGFLFGNFLDLYGSKCSIQESSLATDDCIWLGIDDPDPKIMASKVGQINPETGEVSGWVKFHIPEDVLIHTRMHLNREQVAALIPTLQYFVDNGRLPIQEGSK